MRIAVELKMKRTIPYNEMGVMFWHNAFIFMSFLSAVVIELRVFCI